MRVQQAVAIAILIAVYVMTAQLSFALHVTDAVESSIWMPAGIGLAAVLLLGNHMALGIAFGVLAAMIASHRSALAGFGIGGVEAVGALAAAFVLRRAFELRPALDRVRDVLALVVTSVVLSLATAASSGGVLVAAGAVPPDHLASAWTSRWWGYLASNLIVTPLVLTWGTRQPAGDYQRQAAMPEVVAFGVAGVVLAGYVFYGWFPEWLPGTRMPYLLVALLLWAGLRFGPRGAATTNFALGTIAIVATTAGFGPFAQLPHYLQVFVSISSLMTLTLTALQVERLGAVRRKGAILTGALDAIVTIDGESRIVEFNPAAERLFGIRAGDAIGQDAMSLLAPPSLRELFRDELAGYLRTGASELLGRRARYHLCRSDGGEFPAEITAVRVPIEGRYLFTAFIRDITAEQAAEKSLRESQRLLEDRVRERTSALMAANQELEHRGELLRESQALANLGSFERHLEHQRLEWSDEMYRIYGRDPATFSPHEGFIASIHPDDRSRVIALIERSHVDRQPFSFEMRIVRPDGEIRVLHSRGRVYVDESDRAVRITGYSQDITAQKAAEHQLRAALREKEVLLREIHHRVKNNLQVISSMLNLQLATVPGAEAHKGLVESQSRIQSMALVHQLLYRSKDLARIDLLEYLQNLVQRLGRAYAVDPDRPIAATVAAPSIQIDLDRAIPCGLIVNELVTNSFHHAFPDGRVGHIEIVLARQDGQLTLEVRDDGVGMPPHFDLDTAQTFGLQIVRTLTQQLDGTIELTRERGTAVRVVFPFTG